MVGDRHGSDRPFFAAVWLHTRTSYTLMSRLRNTPKKRKPRSPQHMYKACDRCGVLTSQADLERYSGLCRACLRQDDDIHQQFLDTQAVLLVRFDCSHWTPNLFSSSLGIDADGYWMQRVRWHEQNPDRECYGQQLECFEPEEWASILAAVQDLQSNYRLQPWRMESMETHSIELRRDNQTAWMEKIADWQCADGDTRFAQLWGQIHRLSNWSDQLKISP